MREELIVNRLMVVDAKKVTARSLTVWERDGVIVCNVDLVRVFITKTGFSDAQHHGNVTVAVHIHRICMRRVTICIPKNNIVSGCTIIIGLH